MEIDSYQTELPDYIIKLESVLSPETCKEIINEYENSKMWRSGSIGAKGTIDKDTRNCEVLPISIAEVINENTEMRKKLDSKIFEAVSKCLKYYNGMFWNLRVQKDTGYELLRYGEGGFYVEHIDHFPEVQRTLTMSLILNDDYEGGEFSFFNKKYLIKPQTGQAIIFPSNFMFPHGVMPIKGGKRYAVVTWFL